MSTISKKFFSVTLGIAMAASLVLPGVSLAQRSPSPGAANLCNRVGVEQSNIVQKLQERESKLTSNRVARAAKLDEARTNRNDKWAETRANNLARRNNFYAELENKAKTDAQKQAVATFKVTIEEAIRTRNAAIDAARTGFRQDVDKAIADRKAAMDAAIAAFKNAVNAALNKAKTDCANGVSPATLRSDLKDALTAARQKFVADVQAIEKLKTSLDSVITARNQAVKQAIDDFKKTVEQARETLKAAFPKNETSPSPTVSPTTS